MAEIVVYTTPWCGYCAAAKELLKNKNVAFEEIDVSMDAELRAEMTKKSGGTTVPQVFINNQSVGGFSDISALDKQGKLDALLKT
jgi:glutaredoxin 3